MSTSTFEWLPDVTVERSRWSTHSHTASLFVCDNFAIIIRMLREKVMLIFLCNYCSFIPKKDTVILSFASVGLEGL